jgi:hypothetical protein
MPKRRIFIKVEKILKGGKYCSNQFRLQANAEMALTES